MRASIQTLTLMKKRTPLYLGARNWYGAIVQTLLEMGGVDADADDANGVTSLLCAVRSIHGAVFKLLVD